MSLRGFFTSYAAGRRVRDLALAVAVGLASASAVSPPAAMASATAHWKAGIEAPLPLDGAPLVANINAVSCPSPGNCSAVGTYHNTASNDDGLVLSETSGSWPTHSSAVMLPKNADTTNQDGTLNSVSCPSVGNCSAAGSYYTSGNQNGLLVTANAGRWHQGVEAQLPTPASGSGIMNLRWISCPSPGNCSAVGDYHDTSGNEVGLLLNQVNGVWHTGVAVSPPANASTTPSYVVVNSVSCSSAGNCTAVGYYIGPGVGNFPLLLSEVSGKWKKGTEALLPANRATAGNQDVHLQSVTCTSAGNCTAVGYYVDRSGNYQGLLLSQVAGKWRTGVQAVLPHGAATTSQSVDLQAVSCRSAGNCSAVGEYNDSSFSYQGLLVNEVSGRWLPGSEAHLPSSADTSPGAQHVQLVSVSCISPGNCTAVGGYNDKSSSQQGLMLSETSGRWQKGIEATLPGNHATTPDVGFGTVSGSGGPGVSCGGLGSCTAVGTYVDTSNDNDGLLLTTVASHPTLAASGPTTGKAGHEITPSSIAARLAGGSAPVGSIIFRVFGPQAEPPRSCVSGGRTVGSAPVAGNKSYHASAGFTPARAGDYWWYAAYGGDASDLPAASKCGPGMAKTVVK